MKHVAEMLEARPPVSLTKQLLFALALGAYPLGALAASGTPYFVAGSSVLVSTTTSANVYAVGGTAAVTSAVKGDLTAFGGSLTVHAPLSGDALLAGGSVRLKSPVSGDARLFGGDINITERVTGDLVAIGGSVQASGGGAAHTFIIGGEVLLTGGAEGPVAIYGNKVTLDGTYAGDVEVTAGGRFTLLPGTRIHGELRYQAPQEAIVSPSAIVEGGIRYTGASYLPTSEEARAIALASFGVFLFVKILGALILAGLVAGLFPTFVDTVVSRAVRGSAGKKFLTLLLGFGVFVATPICVVLLSITFVGLGLAALLTLAYLLLIPLASIYAAIVLGSFIARYVFKRATLRWSDAVVGMLALFLLWSLPLIGGLVISLTVLYMVGVLTALVYRFAFPRTTSDEFEN